MELKDIFSYLGINETEVKDMDGFKTAFEKTYVSGERLKESEFGRNLQGAMIGEFVSTVKQTVKKFGGELTESEVKDLPWKEVPILGLKKITENYNKAIEDAKAEGGKGNDQKVIDLQKKLEESESKFKQIEQLHTETKKKVEETEKSFAEKEKGLKLNYAKDQLFTGAKFKKGTNEFAIKGFRQEFESKYDFTLADDGKTITEVKTKDGKLIPSKNSATSFMTANEVLEMEAINGKLWEENPNGGNPAGNAVWGNLGGQPSVVPAAGEAVKDPYPINPLAKQNERQPA